MPNPPFSQDAKGTESPKFRRIHAALVQGCQIYLDDQGIEAKQDSILPAILLVDALWRLGTPPGEHFRYCSTLNTAGLERELT